MIKTLGDMHLSHLINRRTALASLGLLSPLASMAQNADWPAKQPIRFIVPGPAGAGMDLFARLIQVPLQQVLNQSIVMDYKPGPTASSASRPPPRHAPDGYTLLVHSVAFAVNPSLYADAGYDALKDFVPVARTAMQPLALLVNPKLPVNNLKEFTDYVRAGRGKSITARQAMAASAIWCPRCTKTPPACSWCTFPTGAVHPPSPI